MEVIVKRKIIKIDNNKCNGCGLCIPNCAEGALQIIDGKARLISDLFCDGLGACIGHCPQGAISFETREADKYNEIKVLETNIIPAGKNTIIAHLKHLLDHNEKELYGKAITFLKSKGIDIDEDLKMENRKFQGCPGSIQKSFEKIKDTDENENTIDQISSELSHWPVQLHLVLPDAQYFRNKDIVIAADCSAYSYGNFHQKFLKNKSLVIACPKLDSGLETYVEKIITMIEVALINTITIVRMQVPCCGGLTTIVNKAISKCNRKVPVKEIIISINGEIIKEEWI